MDGGLDASDMAREHLYRTQQRPLASQHCKHASDSEGEKVAGYLHNHLQVYSTNVQRHDIRRKYFASGVYIHFIRDKCSCLQCKYFAFGVIHFIRDKCVFVIRGK